MQKNYNLLNVTLCPYMYLLISRVFQNSLDNDINQHFQDAIDVIQQHSNNSYYDSGKLLF